MGVEEYVSVVSVIVVVVTAFLVWYYARQGTPFVACFFTFWGWFIVGSVCVLLPLDLLPQDQIGGATSVNGTDGTITVVNGPLETFWSVNYWSSLLLAFIINPIVQSYYDSGDFTFRSKMWYSIKDNVILYSVAGVLFSIFIIWAVATSNTGNRPTTGFIICLANSFGLSLVAISLGYSLVELPRTFWYSGNRQVRLNLAQYRAASIYSEDMQCREELNQIYRCLDRLETRVVDNDPLRPFYEIVKKAMPLEDSLDLAAARSSSVFERDKVITMCTEEAITLSRLALLHRYAKKTINRYNLVQSMWHDCVDEALHMEDLLVKERGRPPSCDNVPRYLYYTYQVYYQPNYYRFIAVILSILSIIILWSEATLYHVQLSPFKAALDSVIDSNPVAVQIIALIPFSYICACCIFPLFRLRLGNFYNMRKGHRTDEISLLFNSINMLRLIAPLGYNFLDLCDKHDAAFHKVVGQMDVIPIFGNGLNDVLPIFIPILCFCTFFNVYGRLLKCLNIQRFEYTMNFEDEQLSEGKALIKKEKRKRGIREEVTMVTVHHSDDDPEQEPDTEDNA